VAAAAAGVVVTGGGGDNNGDVGVGCEEQLTSPTDNIVSDFHNSRQ
jgi:hypothetical protein